MASVSPKVILTINGKNIDFTNDPKAATPVFRLLHPSLGDILAWDDINFLNKLTGLLSYAHDFPVAFLTKHGVRLCRSFEWTGGLLVSIIMYIMPWGVKFCSFG